jgi:hypothetical protein
VVKLTFIAIFLLTMHVLETMTGPGNITLILHNGIVLCYVHDIV